ncbi:MAG: OsmC family peroxiredoxin [Alphaproteobacteria bacterium]|nr:OsmC family peroxiredoxin [Alphaproteobacteria bacterium]
MMSAFRTAVTAVRDQLASLATGHVVVREVKSEQVAAFRSEAQVRRFTITIDEPKALGSTDAGPTPIEMLLAAFATCQEVTYRLHAELLGIALEKVAVAASARIDRRGLFGVGDAKAGLLSVHAAVTLTTSAPQSDIRRLQEAVDRFCPVLDSLRVPTPVTSALTVVAPAATGRAAE